MCQTLPPSKKDMQMGALPERNESPSYRSCEVNRTDAVVRFSSSGYTATFCLFFTIFVIVHYLLEPNNPIQSFPFHHDDFSLLSTVLDRHLLTAPRPVSWLFFGLLASGGQTAYYA